MTVHPNSNFLQGNYIVLLLFRGHEQNMEPNIITFFMVQLLCLKDVLVNFTLMKQLRFYTRPNLNILSTNLVYS